MTVAIALLLAAASAASAAAAWAMFRVHRNLIWTTQQSLRPLVLGIALALAALSGLAAVALLLHVVVALS